MAQKFKAYFRRFLKNSAIYLALGMAYLLTLLPYQVILRLGAWLGRWLQKRQFRRLRIAKTNIEHAFKHLPDHGQQLYQAHIDALGKGLFEMAMGWFWSKRRFAKMPIHHEGYEYVDAALARGQGVLFLGLHTTGLDFGAPLLANRYPVYYMYRKADNPILDAVIRRGRTRHCPGVIEQNNMRAMLKHLNAGEMVWYGSDQDFGANSKSVFVPFFDTLAFTLPHYAKIAEKTGAAVIPVAGFRDEANKRFIVRYLAPIDTQNMNEEQAATAMNQALEQLLKGFEAQYYWIHRRYKTRPKGESNFYE